MSTQRQIEANRRNSQLSTGPRTPQGKAVSRFNALKSGINASAQVIPGEDPAELQAIADGYHQDWQPTTYLERFLVDSLIRADWLLQRLARLEADLWTQEMKEDDPMGEVYTRTCDQFTRLQRRIDSTERSYYRALTQLQRLRREAPSDPAPDPRSQAPEEPLAPNEPSAPGIGFVLNAPTACLASPSGSTPLARRTNT